MPISSPLAITYVVMFVRSVLPTTPTAARAPIDRETYRRLATRAKVLSWASLAYMTLEGSIAILAGVLAGSVALIGFGLDSAIEGFASAIIVWRFTGSRMFSEAAEQRAQKLVAVQFFILAPYVGFESAQALLHGERPDVSWLGIALSASSVIVMPYLGIAKQRIADQVGSAATKGEGRQNMLCAYLAGALLIGLLANAALGAWWLDPLIGLLIAGVAIREGLEAWRGEGCACTSDPLAALREEDCRDACCSANSRASDEGRIYSDPAS
jgi:divalent metal cation (Fe/Co/Zn/Cd) transporter